MLRLRAPAGWQRQPLWVAIADRAWIELPRGEEVVMSTLRLFNFIYFQYIISMRLFSPHQVKPKTTTTKKTKAEGTEPPPLPSLIPGLRGRCPPHLLSPRVKLSLLKSGHCISHLVLPQQDPEEQSGGGGGCVEWGGEWFLYAMLFM